MRNRKKVNPDIQEELIGVERGKIVISIYYMREKNLFAVKRKKKFDGQIYLLEEGFHF